MYPNFNKFLYSPDVLAVGLSTLAANLRKFRIGNFSLVFFLLLGIFYTNPVSAIKIGSATINTSEIYVASFSLNSGDFQSRTNIFPDRVFFNASGSLQQYTAAPFSTPFSLWPDNYPLNNWSNIKSADLYTVPTAAFPQAIQLNAALPANFPSQSIMVSSMNIVTKDIILNAYANEADLFATDLPGSPVTVATNNIVKPHSMLHAAGKLNFIYLSASDNKIHSRTYDGTGLSPETAFTNSDTLTSYGVSGCTLNNEEYIAFTYATSSTQICIVTYKPSEFPITATYTLTLETFDSPCVSISQNPRNGKIFLVWFNAGSAFYRTGVFLASGNFSFSPTVNIGAGFEKNFGANLQSFNNFENSSMLPTPLPGQIKNVFLHDASPTFGENIANSGYAAQFPYNDSGNLYAGLITITGYKKYSFYRRQLHFPDECSWQNPQKTLHIEGPPLLNTLVRAEVDFAEVVAGESLARTINAAGGFKPVESGFRIIASASSSQFSIKFDKAMRIASYPDLISTPSLTIDAVKMLAPDNSVVNISHIASSANELLFKPVTDLQLNTSYQIVIASSVIDANGSQIYENRTLNFTTQTSSSQVTENEIIAIEAFSDPGYTTSVASGSEINASATIYLRLEASDPAFNTIDTAAIRVILNDTEPELTTLTLSQTTASSNYFYGSFILSAPSGGNNTFKFKTLKDSVYHPVKVEFPTLSSASPGNSSIGVLINTSPTLTFSENILASSVTTATVRLSRGGFPADFGVSVSGNVITINPEDTSEGYLRTETLYEISAGYGIKDLAGNPFINLPATFTSSFTTQASQTPALTIATMSFYTDAGFSNEVQPGSDYPATGTLYLSFTGTDGQSLTRDYTIASISTGQAVVLTETASATGIYRGFTSFSGLGDRFSLKIQSVTSPAANASLLITYPTIAPTSPASGAANILSGVSINLQADESLLAASVNSTNVRLMLNGSAVATSLAYTSATRQITITPTVPLQSSGLYTVSISDLLDLSGNPQIQPLIYSFTVIDYVAPQIVSFIPTDNSTGILINSLITIDFSENILASSINSNNVKLTRDGATASYTILLSGSQIQIDADDAPDGYLRTATDYQLQINSAVKDLAGNSLANTPEPFLLKFRTQPAQTLPASISLVQLYSDAGFTSILQHNADYPATGTLYISFTGVDGQNLTRDYTIASISTGQTATLTETASATGIYRGSTSFTGLGDRFDLKIQSVTSPSASASLLITYPALTPVEPASGTGNILSGAVIKIQADEELQAASVNATSIKLMFNGSSVATTLAYTSSSKQISITPTAPMQSSGVYTVTVNDLLDISGNPQIKPLIYSFTVVDYIAPQIVSFIPADSSTGILINSLISINFTENILATSVNSDSVKLTRNGVMASYTILLSGNQLKIDADDAPDGYLRTATDYQLQINSAIKDPSGNSLTNSPEPFVLNFRTQPTQTLPLSINLVQLYSDAGFTSILQPNGDYPATGTLYLSFTGVDGQSLTRDYTIASISTGQTALLTETASATGIYRGSTSFTSLGDRFNLKVQSITSPSASASLLITYPTPSPVAPASGAVNIPVNSSVKIRADEALQPASVNAANIRLLLNGATVPTSLSYVPLLREITIAPATLLASEKKYLVIVENLTDLQGNPQLKPLIYSFTIEDKTPPTITGFYPPDTSTGVTIDRQLTIDFSENISPASVNAVSVKLTRNGVIASYGLTVTGTRLIIDPDDAPDSYLRTNTGYKLQINSAVKDLAGNSLANFPEPFELSFSTQPSQTAPAAITSLSIYKDPLLITTWGSFEPIPASTTVYLKVTGVDGATQTRDLATLTLSLSWASDFQVILQETASNSSGIYIGSYSFAAIPLYGVPVPQPVVSTGRLTFSTDQAPANAATLTVVFPDFLPGQTTVNSLAGKVTAANATNVRIDSPVILKFSDDLFDAGNATSLRISSGAVDIAATRLLSSDQRQITVTPSVPLPFASLITISGIYSDSGLKSKQGNPLFRPFSFTFSTQASETPPGNIAQINLFPDSTLSALNQYSTNQDFINTGTMYIQAIGSDASANTIDSTLVTISTGATVKLLETTTSSGVFSGSYIYTNLADGFVFNVASVVNPAASQTLQLSLPVLSPIQPASGAINVSNAIVIRVKSSESLKPVSVNNSTFRFFKNSTELSGALSYLPDDNSVQFIPAQALEYNGDYSYSVSGITDLAGNTSVNDLIVSFKVQSFSVPPLTINSIKAFSDKNFSIPLPDGALIAPSAQIFLEISAIDLSPTTADATSLTLSSNVSGNLISAALIETESNSGLFRGITSLFADENATLILASKTDPAVKTTLRTYSYPKFNALQPASGSINLFLDTQFFIETSKNIDAATLSTSTILLANQGIASYQITLVAPSKIGIASELKPSDTLYLRITSQLKDTDGLPFPELLARYNTLTPSVKEFRLYSDSSFLSPLDNGDEVEAEQIIYARLVAANSWENKPETATAAFFDGLATTALTLAEVSPGVFTTSFVTPGSPARTLTVTPENLPEMTVTLTILPGFVVSAVSPASGAVNVPSDVWPSWTFTRPVRLDDVNSTNCKLVMLPGLSQVPVSFSLSPSGKQIRMQPAGLLPLLTTFEMRLNQALRDTADNQLSQPVITRFKTQPLPLPPNEMLSLKNYETADYATSTLAVAIDGNLYLELVAKDTSFSTYDTARVRVDSSDSTFDGLELTLIEASPPSGIYRLALPINLPPGTTIKIQSQADPDFVIEVKAQLRTRLLNITPASGSVGFYLDSPITLSFSHSIDSTTLENGLQILASAGQQILFNAEISDAGRTLVLAPKTGYASATRHALTITTSLRDSNGLYILSQNAFFTTRSETSATFNLLTGLPPLDSQLVSLTGEAVRGPLVLVASTTDMFSTYPETRLIKLVTATQTFSIILNESEPGSFKGNFNFSPETGAQVLATLIFGNNPALSFNLAATPQLLAISPASGSKNIDELPLFNASFSRMISYKTATDALKIACPGTIVNTIPVGPATDSLSVSWQPVLALPVDSDCLLQLSGLTDYLGQPLTDYQHDFSTGGRQGISVYSDNSFAQLIATNQLTIPQIYVEIAASGTQYLVGRSFMLEARTGTRATETIKLLVEPISVQSGLFRCSLNIIPGKAVPEYPLTLLPGEWLELAAPLLTDDRKLLYYQHATSANPLSITDLRFYSERDYAQRVSDTLANPSLYIEIEAEDLNWFTSDTTRVKITSDADSTGFSLDLKENGTHSSSFRNFIRLSPVTTDKTAQTLKVLPDQRIHVESETSPFIRASIRYLPENSLNHIAVFPSPARGDHVNFRFYLNFAAYVHLEIFDTAGDEIKGFIIRGQEGENNFRWPFPSHLANGVYFYRMKLDNLNALPTRKRKERGKFAVLR